MANFVLDVTRIPIGEGTPVAAVEPYRFCVQVNSPSDQHVDITPALTARPLGVIMDALDADQVADEASVAVRVLGIAPVRLGGTVNAGQNVSTAADGRGVHSTTATHFIAGVAMQSGVANDIVDVLLTPGGNPIPA